MPVTHPRLCRTLLAALITLVALTGCTSAGSGTSGPPATATQPAVRSPSATSASIAGRSPSTVLADAIAALKGGGSVHNEFVARGGSHVTAVYSDDSGTNSGRQVITVNGTEHAEVLVVDGVAYIKGNETALTEFFGFTSAQAGYLVNRWIAFHPGDSGGKTDYDAVVAGVTLAGVADEVNLTGPLTLTPPTTVAGQLAIGVRGRVPSGVGVPAGTMATLYVAAIGRPVPVAYQLGFTGNLRYTITFGRWGEPLHLTAPTGAIPVASSSHTTV